LALGLVVGKKAAIILGPPDPVGLLTLTERKSSIITGGSAMTGLRA